MENKEIKDWDIENIMIRLGTAFLKQFSILQSKKIQKICLTTKTVFILFYY